MSTTYFDVWTTPAEESKQFRGTFGTADGFGVWESDDGTTIQFTGPDGRILVEMSRVGLENFSGGPIPSPA